MKSRLECFHQRALNSAGRRDGASGAAAPAGWLGPVLLPKRTLTLCSIVRLCESNQKCGGGAQLTPAFTKHVICSKPTFDHFLQPGRLMIVIGKIKERIARRGTSDPGLPCNLCPCTPPERSDKDPGAFFSLGGGFCRVAI